MASLNQIIHLSKIGILVSGLLLSLSAGAAPASKADDRMIAVNRALEQALSEHAKSQREFERSVAAGRTAAREAISERHIRNMDSRIEQESRETRSQIREENRDLREETRREKRLNWLAD